MSAKTGKVLRSRPYVQAARNTRTVGDQSSGTVLTLAKQPGKGHVVLNAGRQLCAGGKVSITSLEQKNTKWSTSAGSSVCSCRHDGNGDLATGFISRYPTRKGRIKFESEQAPT